MKNRLAIALAIVTLPLPAFAQVGRNVPEGSPLGAAPSQDVQATLQRDAERARLQAAARARSDAQAMTDAFTPAPVATIVDEGRARPTTSTFDVPNSAARPAGAPSPFGGYYQIRTPWDRR